MVARVTLVGGSRGVCERHAKQQRHPHPPVPQGAAMALPTDTTCTFRFARVVSSHTEYHAALSSRRSRSPSRVSRPKHRFPSKAAMSGGGCSGRLIVIVVTVTAGTDLNRCATCRPNRRSTSARR